MQGNQESEVGKTELATRVITSAADLYATILEGLPEGGRMVRNHVEAGAGVELIVQLAPRMAVGVCLVDSTGARVPVAAIDLGALPATH